MNITILGAGSWGIALAAMLCKRGHTVRMWEFNPADAHMLHQLREHPKKLPGITLPQSIQITSSLCDAMQECQYAVCAVPSQTMRATMKALVAQVAQPQRASVRAWIIVSKGIECGTLRLMTDVLIEEVPDVTMATLAVLSGPSHAEEVSRDIPTTVVAASANAGVAAEVQQEFSTETFRIYTNDDVTGVELAASVKNVIAIAAGICDGLGFGDNTKGAILTRGMVEINRLGRRLGAKEQTFSGLAGIGDLITTCISRHSRNRKVGELIGSGLNLQQALDQMVMVAEGVETAKSVYQLSKKYSIEMPITAEVYKTLFEGKSPKLAARDLMGRDFKPEWW